MIKFLADGKDGPMIGLGLQPENLARLQRDEPIVIDLRKIKPDLEIDLVIFFVADIDRLQQQMRDHGILTDETIIHKIPPKEA